MKWLFPEEQRKEHERAVKIARKWRARNMRWYERRIDDFIRYVRDHRTPQPIGKNSDPTYWRRYVIPRNPICNFYLHEFLKDDMQDLHTHRMMNVTLVLQGPGYDDERFESRPIPGQPLPPLVRHRVRRLRPVLRTAKMPHRVVLDKTEEGKPIPVWSLFIGLPHFWPWGFWCGSNDTGRWVDERVYLKKKNGGPNRYDYETFDELTGCG